MRIHDTENLLVIRQMSELVQMVHLPEENQWRTTKDL
jgi:hypothetical protein